jgi:hypothetical protein
MTLVPRHALPFAALLVVLAAPSGAQQTAAAEYPGLETGKMWTFDVPPLDYWARRYDFRPDQAWLDRVRLASVRQVAAAGCSASFVSSDGLVMTNHHCARECIADAARPAEDLLANGFYATRREDERPCADWNIDQLLAISDVTDSVDAAVPAGADPNRAAAARTARMRALERACAAQGPDLLCQVVTMYRGGQYKLYTFRRYTDVRLVFAPEGQMAFFGGDPDNFTYPRHDLDVSFYRVYRDDEPLRPEQYFRFSRTGAQAGDLVFVTGNPGSTGRLNTVAQLEFIRDYQYPYQLDVYARQIAAYKELSALSPERAAALRNTIFSLENSQKAVRGYLAGLIDPALMAHKRRWETDFRARVQADPTLRRAYGDAWDEVARIDRELAALDGRRRFHAVGAFGSRLLGYAGVIARWHAETAKPDSARLAPFRDANRAGLERQLYSATPVDTAVERRLLVAYLSALAARLPANDPVRRAALGGRTPEAAAAALVQGATILTADQRRALVMGGAAAVAGSADPFLALARVIDPLERAVSRQVSDLLNRESRQSERIARALLAVFGSGVAPDATFSLRITDGEVRSYPYNGTIAQPFTTFHGLYDRWAGFGGHEPWHLPQRWIDRRGALDLTTPLNGISTNDIIGGNSGSPVINRDAEVVGLIFDGNIESLPPRWLYTEATNRSVWVDARGIVEALRKIYDAGALADELLGGR